jgi:hypothetical protein
LKKYKSPGSDQILTKNIQAWAEIHKLINSTWDKEASPDHQWKESIIVPIYLIKLIVSNIHGISLLPTLYKSLPIILLSGLKIRSKNYWGSSA